ncbi:MAG: hypothetical protein LBJ80_01305 [Rickettsiales bacterium]|nr:hypothetical protein [Rickettsiales bacterium]MDR1261046.1 hypothetical protein [Rickettsiales bacterium]
MAEAKENPIVTLKAQAEEFDFSKLRAAEDNKGANSGETMHGDFHRMNFVVNKKDVDKNFINKLIEKAWKQYAWTEFKQSLTDASIHWKEFYSSEEQVHLLKAKIHENKNYRSIAKEIFKEIFKSAGAEVPSDPILEELVTNCNQSSYYGGGLVINVFAPALFSHKLVLNVPQGQGTIHINCTNRNCVNVKSGSEISIIDTKLLTELLANGCDPKEAVICQLNSSLEFTLESQDGKDGVTYKDGKLSLTVPQELENYHTTNKEEQLQSDDTVKKSLFDVIIESFLILIEKFVGTKLKNKQGIHNEIKNTLSHSNSSEAIVIKDTGYSPIKIECSLGDPLKVDSHLESVEPPTHCGDHVHGS